MLGFKAMYEEGAKGIVTKSLYFLYEQLNIFDLFLLYFLTYCLVYKDNLPQSFFSVYEPSVE
jgi:hypothetical protein